MRWGMGLSLVAAAILATGAYAIGAGTSQDSVTLCAVKKSRALSLGAKGKCGRGETKVTIAKFGPTGPAGGAGAAGPTGATGPAGSPGSDAVVVPEAVHLVKSPATTACQANPGTFCAPQNQSGTFDNFPTISGFDIENVGYYKDPSGRVQLSGSAGWFTSGGGGGGYVPDGPFYLPVGYRPAHVRYFQVPSTTSFTSQDMTGSRSIQIRPDGLVYAPGAFNAFSLDGVSFRP